MRLAQALLQAYAVKVVKMSADAREAIGKHVRHALEQLEMLQERAERAQRALEGIKMRVGQASKR